MKGFKDSTKTQYAKGGRVCGCGTAKPVRKSEGGAVARGNRSQATEAREEEEMLRQPVRPPRATRPNYTQEEGQPARPRQTRGPTGAGFSARPLVSPARPRSPRG